jgi:hypothetical protein
MSPLRCAYCGTLSENPIELRWILRGKASRASVLASLPLCTRCRNSWCPAEPAAVQADPLGEDREGGHERRVA